MFQRMELLIVVIACASAVFECQGTGGADADAISTFLASGLPKRFVGKGGNYSFKATVSKTENADTEALPAYPHTSSAENTLVRVIGEEGVTIIYGQFPHELPEMFRFKTGAEVAGYFLKLADAITGTVSTVYRMRGHE